MLKKADSSNGYRLSVTTGWALKLELWSGGTLKTVTSTARVPYNRWCHLAGRYDGSELRVFINGALDTATTATTFSLTATTEPLRIGGDSNYYYGARYYDPYIGRFTQRDPIGQGVNWYAYAANNPVGVY